MPVLKNRVWAVTTATIFLTVDDLFGYDDFQHDETTYRFEKLRLEDGRLMPPGPCWAFVDWLLPECSGLEFCRRLRADKQFQHAHITLMLDNDNLNDRRRALKAGADDYMIGGFSRSDILDRVLAIQADGPRKRVDQVVEFGALKIDLEADLARWDGEPIPLRLNELRLLQYFAENPDRVFSREELISAIGKGGDPDYVRVVDVWVKRLRAGFRKAKAPDLLRTVHGRGYVFDSIS